MVDSAARLRLMAAAVGLASALSSEPTVAGVGSRRARKTREERSEAKRERKAREKSKKRNRR